MEIKMTKEKLIKILEGVLLKFDGVTDGKLLLNNGFSYNEIQNSKKTLKFVENLK